jgi:hypothetical protein
MKELIAALAARFVAEKRAAAEPVFDDRGNPEP